MATQRILVFGGSGMLGHAAVRTLSSRFEVAATVRGAGDGWNRHPLFRGLNVEIADGVDAAEFVGVERAITRFRPTAVINCIGIVKQRDAAFDAVTTMQINALFPHRLADLCERVGSRLIHISTDCVFSGSGGGYREADMPDADDLYGRSKQLGEIIRPGCLTIRTSIIGRELAGAHGLLEWFLGHRGGSVDGFTRAVFSGLTTLELSRVLAQVVSDHGDLEGLFHVASEPISKHELLVGVHRALDLGIHIRPVDDPVIDRSLDGSRFTTATGIHVPSWDKMISDIATDPTPYDDWRRVDGST